LRLLAAVALCLGVALVWIAPWALGMYAHVQGRHALAAGDAVAAQHHADGCLRRWPEGGAAHLLAAQAARQSERYEAAQHHLGASERLLGDSADVRLERALLDAQQGDTLEAEALLGRSGDLEQSRQLAEALARGYAVTLQIDDARRYVDELLRQQPASATALMCRGQVAEAVEQLDEALSDYRQALASAPRFTPARLRLAKLLYRTGRPWEAAAHLEQMRADTPDDAGVLLQLALCRHDLAEVDEARGLLDVLLSAAPDQREALRERGRMRLWARDFTGAAEDLRRLAKLSPHHLEGQLLLARCLQDQGNPELQDATAAIRRIEDATRDLNRLRNRSVEAPPGPAALLEIGQAYVALDRGDEALPPLYRVLRLAPQRRPVHAVLAQCYRSRGQLALARQHERLSSDSGQ
jgi:predicted Zn-dependent protease